MDRTSNLTENLQLSELPFFSFCGEGSEVGLPAVFIRSYGCNRRCKYCDTEYSYNGEKIDISIRNLIDLVYKTSSQRAKRRVFLTGGEITLQKNLYHLIKSLNYHKFEIILQTNGTNFIPEVFNKVNLLSVDVKGPSSGELADQSIIDRIYQEYCNKTSPKIQFKYIVANNIDYDYAKDNILKYPKSVNIIQPEWSSFQKNRNWLAKKVLSDKEIHQNGSEVRLSLQMHKLWGIK